MSIYLTKIIYNYQFHNYKLNFNYIFSNVGGVPLDFETKDFLGRSRDQFVMSINIRSFVL